MGIVHAGIDHADFQPFPGITFRPRFRGADLFQRVDVVADVAIGRRFFNRNRIPDAVFLNGFYAGNFRQFGNFVGRHADLESVQDRIVLIIDFHVDALIGDFVQKLVLLALYGRFGCGFCERTDALSGRIFADGSRLTVKLHDNPDFFGRMGIDLRRDVGRLRRFKDGLQLLIRNLEA